MFCYLIWCKLLVFFLGVHAMQTHEFPCIHSKWALLRIYGPSPVQIISSLHVDWRLVEIMETCWGNPLRENWQSLFWGCLMWYRKRVCILGSKVVRKHSTSTVYYRKGDIRPLECLTLDNKVVFYYSISGEEKIKRGIEMGHQSL